MIHRNVRHRSIDQVRGRRLRQRDRVAGAPVHEMRKSAVIAARANQHLEHLVEALDRHAAVVQDEQRKVARDAYVHWQGSRYSVPWAYAGKEVWVRQIEGRVEVLHGARRIAEHGAAPRKHLVISSQEHHEGIPLGVRQDRKTLVHIRQTAPVVEVRPLEAYESVALGGGR